MHPILQRLFREAERAGLGVIDLAQHANLNKNTTSEWHSNPEANPRIRTLQRALDTVGLELVVRRKKESR